MLQNVLLAEWISSWHPLMPLRWNLLLILSSTHTIAFANLTKPSRTNSAALCCVQLCLFLKLSSIRHDWVQLSFSLLHGLLYGYVDTHTQTHTQIYVCVCVSSLISLTPIDYIDPIFLLFSHVELKHLQQQMLDFTWGMSYFYEIWLLPVDGLWYLSMRCRWPIVTLIRPLHCLFYSCR